MNALSSDVRLPLYQRLRDHLAEQIANNRWRPGEAIPTEAALQRNTNCLLAPCAKRSMHWSVKVSWNVSKVEALSFAGLSSNLRCSDSSVFKPLPASAGCQRVASCSIEPVAAPSAVAQALGLPLDAPVIRIVRVRLLDVQPVLAEEIWLPRNRFQPLLEIDLSSKGPLLYPIYEEVCGQVVASAEETLTAESVNDVHARLLQVPVNSPVVVIERLARDYAGTPLEWRRSRGHAEHFRYRVDIR